MANLGHFQSSVICRRIKLSAILLSLICSSALAAPSEWKLKKSQKEIELFTSIDEQGNKWVKATTSVKAPWWSLLSLLRLTEEGPDWIENAIIVELLAQPDDFTDIVRTQFKAPLMFQNREMITVSKITWDHENHTLKIDVAQYHEISPTEGFVKMENIQGQWHAAQMNNGLVQISWTGTGLAGGNIPDWLASSVMTSSTFKTFKALQTRLVQKKYHVKPLGYILTTKNH